MIEVYYVEDDENIAQAVKDYLELQGYKVKILETIAVAKQVLREHTPSIVLVDWNMPDGPVDTQKLEGASGYFYYRQRGLCRYCFGLSMRCR